MVQWGKFSSTSNSSNFLQVSPSCVLSSDLIPHHHKALWHLSSLISWVQQPPPLLRLSCLLSFPGTVAFPGDLCSYHLILWPLFCTGSPHGQQDLFYSQNYSCKWTEAHQSRVYAGINVLHGKAHGREWNRSWVCRVLFCFVSPEGTRDIKSARITFLQPM